MANEDLSQFEALLGRLMSPENNARQQAEVWKINVYTSFLIDVILTI